MGLSITILESAHLGVTINEPFNVSLVPTAPATIDINVGVPGASATITVGTTTTLAPGLNATVTNVGTATNAILDFGIPAGEQGIQGPKGDTGDSGVVYATTPLSYNSGTKTISIDLSAYATQSYVTSQGYITISALTPYLTSATAAATYYPLSNPEGYITAYDLAGYATESWVTSQGYLTSVDLEGYATESWVTSQGYLIDATSDGYGYVRKDGAWSYSPKFYQVEVGSQTTLTSGQYLINNGFFATNITAGDIELTSAGGGFIKLGLAGIQFTAGGDLQTVPFLPADYYDKTSADARFYPLTLNPAGYITSAALSGYATQSWVTSQGYITSSALSPYLTSATAASTYQTIAGMSSYATLASPTLTGDPKAPTPATGDNDTSIATTAFVKAQGYLTSSAAASTYQTLAGMSSYLTTAAAASTYYPLTNPSGFITSASLTGYALLNGTSNFQVTSGTIKSMASDDNFVQLNETRLEFGNGVTPSGLSVSGTGITFADSTVQTTAAVAGIPDAPSDSQTYGRNNGAWTVVSGGSTFNGGPVANPITIAGTTIDSEMSSDYFGVELSSDHSQFAELEYNKLTVANGSGSMQVTPAGITFTDSTVQYTAFNPYDYATIASPTFTGTPAAPTATTGDSSTQIATTAFVQGAIIAGSAHAETLQATVRNNTGSTLSPFTVVYINGALGNNATVAKAQANSEATSSGTFAVTQASIANNADGIVISAGVLSNVNTSAYTDGDKLYLSPTTAGGVTTTKPSAPNHLVYVGVVTRSHPTQGTVSVRIQNGYELDELHDVAIASKTNLDLLAYESSTSLWKNKSFSTLGLLTSSTAASTYAPLASPTFTGTVTIPAGASISGFAPLASPSLTGTPLSTTAAADTNTTQIATTAYVVGQASATMPVVNGTATIGTSLKYARADHIHPTDTSRAALASPTFTGTPLSTTASADTNTTQIATTAYVVGQASSTTPSATGTAAVGTSLKYARADHVHANPLPTGGTTGQVLAKIDATNYNVQWTTAGSGSGAAVIDIQTFGSSSTSGSFTWTKPTGAKWVRVICFGSGGGGGSGARYATSSGRSGGGGGAGGQYVIAEFDAASLPATVSVGVAAGGAGGVAQTVDSTNGNNGSTGNTSNFSNLLSNTTSAGLGAGGTTATGAATGAIVNYSTLGGNAIGSAGAGGAGAIGTASTAGLQSLSNIGTTGGGGGGGGGAGVTAFQNGGTGGYRSSSLLISTIGAAGGNGNTRVAAQDGLAGTFIGWGGMGAGGGGYTTASIGMNGGKGGWPGGGGGGGGATDNGFASGAGGAGGNGAVFVLTFF